MNWFVAKICFRIITGYGSGKVQVEEQLRLICAPDEADAWEQARQLGLAEEETFLNVQGQPVHWQWLGTAELQQVALQHRAELLSAVHEPAAPAEYLQQISDRCRTTRNRIGSSAAAPAAGCPAGGRGY